MNSDKSLASPDNSKLLSPLEAARLLQVSTNTLAVWRCEKRYRLPYVKIGSLVRYRQVDVETFIQSRRLPISAGTVGPRGRLP
jgi:predicted DNA-binding transcriptional regulator AlpA